MTYSNSYAKVDRSGFTPNFNGRAGDEMVDIGWAEGVLQDGRPYHLECWSLAGTTGVTVFMASDGLEDSEPLPVHALLEESGVITLRRVQELSLLHFADSAGTPCLSISYVVANADDEYFADAHPPLRPYPGREAPTPARTGDLLDVLDYVNEEGFVTQDTLDMLDAILDDMTRPEPRSPMAEARRAAKALAKLQPKKKKRPKRRKFRKPEA